MLFGAATSDCASPWRGYTVSRITCDDIWRRCLRDRSIPTSSRWFRGTHRRFFSPIFTRDEHLTASSQQMLHRKERKPIYCHFNSRSHCFGISTFPQLRASNSPGVAPSVLKVPWTPTRRVRQRVPWSEIPGYGEARRTSKVRTEWKIVERNVSTSFETILNINMMCVHYIYIHI